MAPKERRRAVAQFDERIVAHILLWEVSYTAKPGEPGESMYRNASRKGYHVVPGDAGGPTMCGVTIGTYTQFRKRQGKPAPTVAELRRLPYAEWIEIMRSMFWTRIKGDGIRSQSVALMLMDWTWTSGVSAIKRVQRMLGTAADGIVGSKTLSLLNSGDPAAMFRRIAEERERFYREVAAKPGQRKFLQGWLNRTRSIVFRG